MTEQTPTRRERLKAWWHRLLFEPPEPEIFAAPQPPVYTGEIAVEMLARKIDPDAWSFSRDPGRIFGNKLRRQHAMDAARMLIRDGKGGEQPLTFV